ncbi:bacteriophage protein [Komagataeibacter oboediens DSM 11826]|uniref:DUF3277 domain-containing protein n=1 Tax=Komagataeibacter oboediens TaxID=65958 RepID=A0A318QTX9_9PROT|nr:phage protein [Komagataeibacter oboediens]PYD81414.1 hypothetical protein CFR80_11910 [Komagataeibacter oboediens]GBR29269.1 bacteriophage protein [Komagataeibacter oboediens DSM 11826]
MAIVFGTYSFQDVTASIVGSGLAVSLGSDAGAAEEGISIEMEADKTNLAVGADGSYMHSLHAANAGTITVRLLKNSPQNALLSAAYNAQRLSSALWGKNVIVVRQNVSGDTLTAAGAAFLRWPNIEYANDGGVVTWAFRCGIIDGVLGTY